LFTCLIFKAIEPVRSLAEEREYSSNGQIEPTESTCLPGVATLMSEHLACPGDEVSTGSMTTHVVVHSASSNLDRVLEGGRLEHLLAQHLFGEVPADGDDLGCPCDASTAKKHRGPRAVEVAAVCGKDIDEAPITLVTSFTINAEARHTAETPEEKGNDAIEH